MTKAKSLFLFLIVTISFSACSGKPSEQDIKDKILLGYLCPESARVNDLTILKTEETKGTDNPHVFTYSVRGEIEWPDGCKLMGSGIQAGTKEKIEKTVTLTKSGNGRWQ